ncbi:hypothetical protein SRHO_G00239660 [Serrasalmus rhombeus]
MEAQFSALRLTTVFGCLHCNRNVMKYPDFRLKYKSKEPQEQSAGPERELSDITVISVVIVFSAVSLFPEGPVSLLFSLNSASLQ